MRTKTLLCAAVLAASLASSMAQNVYSLNVVGYVTVTLPHGFTCVANPLDATLGGTAGDMNNITNLFAGAANGCEIQIFLPSPVNDFAASGPLVAKSKWNSGFEMPPGVGAMFFNGGSDFVVTYTGQVEQGAYTVGTLPHGFTMVGAPVPIGGDITNAVNNLGYTPVAGDQVTTWGGTDWNNANLWTAKNGGKWTTTTSINPGSGFLYFNANSSSVVWTSNFTVQ